MAVGATLAAAQVVTACGDSADQDLCAQYAGLVAAAEEWQQQDPLTANPDEVGAATEQFQADLDEFQAMAEGRLVRATSTLRATIDAFREVVAGKDNESLGTARPLVAAAKENVNEAWAVVETLADAQCDPS